MNTKISTLRSPRYKCDPKKSPRRGRDRLSNIVDAALRSGLQKRSPHHGKDADGSNAYAHKVGVINTEPIPVSLYRYRIGSFLCLLFALHRALPLSVRTLRLCRPFRIRRSPSGRDRPLRGSLCGRSAFPALLLLREPPACALQGFVAQTRYQSSFLPSRRSRPTTDSGTI